MKKYTVNVRYEMVHTVEVEAESEEDAIDLAEEEWLEWLDANPTEDFADHIIESEIVVYPNQK